MFQKFLSHTTALAGVGVSTLVYWYHASLLCGHAEPSKTGVSTVPVAVQQHVSNSILLRGPGKHRLHVFLVCLLLLFKHGKHPVEGVLINRGMVGEWATSILDDLAKKQMFLPQYIVWRLSDGRQDLQSQQPQRKPYKRVLPPLTTASEEQSVCNQMGRQACQSNQPLANLLMSLCHGL